MKATRIVLPAIIALALSACGGDDKAAGTSPEKAAPAADTGMTEASESMAETSETAAPVMIDHARDAAEFELRRSIGGVDRMIEQYKADGHATDELEAQKAELSASLDALLGG